MNSNTNPKQEFATELTLILFPWLQSLPVEVHAEVMEQIRQLLAKYELIEKPPVAF